MCRCNVLLSLCVLAANKFNTAVKAVAAAHGVDLNAVASPAAVKQLQPTAGTLNAAGGCSYQGIAAGQATIMASCS